MNCCPIAIHAANKKYKAMKARVKKIKVPVYGKATPGHRVSLVTGKVGGIVLVGSAA